MFYIGAAKTFKSFEIYFSTTPFNSVSDHLTHADWAMISLIESIDAFLFALVLLIFAYGIYQIFITEHVIESSKQRPAWLQIKNISELKIILIEVIIVMLFVFFLKIIFIHIDEAKWQILVLPISIFLLSLSLYFMKKSH